jgi:hypothetical protein
MGMGSYFVQRWLFSLGLGGGIFREGLALVISILAGLVILVGSSKLLRIAELDLTLNLVKARFKGLVTH